MNTEKSHMQQSKGENTMLEGILRWIQHRPRRVAGVIIGFLAGLSYHYLGFLDTLILIIFITIGLVVGKYLDERSRDVGKVLDRLFTSDQ